MSWHSKTVEKFFFGLAAKFEAVKQYQYRVKSVFLLVTIEYELSKAYSSFFFLCKVIYITIVTI